MQKLRLQSIKRLRATPRSSGKDAEVVDCLGGRAKWIPDAQILSIKAHLVSDDGADEHFAELLREESTFSLEVFSETGSVGFSVTAVEDVELRSATARPNQGPFTCNYYLKLRAEPVSPPGDELSASLAPGTGGGGLLLAQANRSATDD